MKNSIVICGDSFNVGIGCRDLANEPYGALLGKHLNKSVINLAKGSSTNLSIYLQAKYVVDELADKAELVIVSPTSYNRVEWFPFDHTQMGDLTNLDVNYHQYPPYGKDTYMTLLDHPYKDDARYNGMMFTENYMGVIDYWETFASKNKESGYYARFKDEPKERSKVLYDFAGMIFDEKIERLKCIGLMTMAHQLLKQADINHLILTHELTEYKKFINEGNLVELSWGDLSLSHPDDLPSLHTSAQGHVVAYNIVLDKIEKNGWVR
jgi:hypothetical protein